MKNRYFTFAMGMLIGAVLFGGGTAYAAGVMAELSAQPIYVDGQRVQMTAYSIGGNNYVKLRDIGQAVGFNVYWQDGVQIDSDAPYTGEAPAQAPSAGAIRVSSYKGNTLKAGDRSGLMIGPSGPVYTVTSSNPAVVAVEQISGNWVAVAKSAGLAVITVSNGTGGTGSLSLTVEGAIPAKESSEPSGEIDLNANMEIRQEMVRLINQTRKANGVAELTVNEALMNAAQDCSAQMFTDHDSEYECGAAKRYGYPYGFGANLTWFTGSTLLENAAEKAVKNWINSTYHFQTMIDPASDTIGVGVTIQDGRACCYMFTGVPNSYSAYG